MKKDDITVYAETQGLYTIAVSGELWGKISNSGMKGRWLAYPIDAPQVAVDVTHRLHNDIEGAIAEIFA